VIAFDAPRRRRSDGRHSDGRRKVGRSYVVFALIAIASALVIWLLAELAYWIAPAGAPVSVPDFIGKSYDTAVVMAARDRLGIRVIARRPDSKMPKDSIIGQLPYAGERVRQGRSIAVIVSDGRPTAQVPNVSGMTQREATVALENVRLDVGGVAHRHDPSVVAGTVIEQSIDPLTAVPLGTKVDVTVATGRALRYTPQFVGLPLAMVQQAAQENGITLDKPSYIPPAPKAPAKGIVVAQDPTAGTMLDSGTKVALQISGGPLETPSPSVNPQTPVLPNPDTMRGLRVSVVVPPENPPAQVRIVVQDGTGARTVWDQKTTGGQTLWFDLGVTGTATLETYVNDQLVSATPI
jgi:serine/threonine-protein kinase